MNNIFTIEMLIVLVGGIVLFIIFVLLVTGERRQFDYATKDCRICKGCHSIQIREWMLFFPIWRPATINDSKCKCNEYLY